jgi:D-tyrosyl-tRNA(Tyr) deacylase
VLLQRVEEASVDIDGSTFSSIKKGLLLFLGIENEDSTDDISWLINKISALRIFSDEDGKMNLSIKDIAGELLIVSQFTLHASTKKGNRPSFIKAARPELAIPLYENFKLQLEEELGKARVKFGVFGADMKVRLVNNGPVTIWLDSKNKE